MAVPLGFDSRPHTRTRTHTHSARARFSPGVGAQHPRPFTSMATALAAPHPAASLASVSLKARCQHVDAEQAGTLGFDGEGRCITRLNWTNPGPYCRAHRSRHGKGEPR